MVTPEISPTDRAHFEKKIERIPFCTCWIWNASTLGTRVKYGAFGLGKRVFGAHRVAYWIYKGAVPDGLHIDHTCNVSLCVNPDHLEAVTQSENNRRMMERTGHGNSNKTHCPQGHPYDEENTRWYAGRRWCRECKRGKLWRKRK